MKEMARRQRASQVQNVPDSDSSSDPRSSHQLFPEPRRVSRDGTDNVAKKAQKVLGHFNKFQPYVNESDRLLGVPTQPATPVPKKSLDGKAFPYPKSEPSSTPAAKTVTQNVSASETKTSNIQKSSEKNSSSSKDRNRHDKQSDASLHEKRKESPEKKLKPNHDVSSKVTVEKDAHDKHKKHDKSLKEKSERRSHDKVDKNNHEKRDRSHSEKNIKVGHERTSSGGNEKADKGINEKSDKHDKDDHRRSTKSSHDKSETSKHDKKGHRRTSSSSSSHISHSTHTHHNSNVVPKASADTVPHTNSNSAKSGESQTSPANTVLKPRKTDKTNSRIISPVLEDIVNLKTQPTDSQNDDYSRVQQGLRTPPNGIVNGFRKPDLNLIMPKDLRPSGSGLHDILKEMIIEPPLTGIHTPKKEEKFPFSSSNLDVSNTASDTSTKGKDEISKSATPSEKDQSLDLSSDSETEQTPNTSTIQRDVKPQPVPTRALTAVKGSRPQEMTSTESSSSESSESGSDSETSTSDDEAEDDEENKERDKEKVPPDVLSPDKPAVSPKQEHSSWSLESIIAKLNNGTSPLDFRPDSTNSVHRDDNFNPDVLLGPPEDPFPFDIDVAVEELKRSDHSVIDEKVISPVLSCPTDFNISQHSPGAASTASNGSCAILRSPKVTLENLTSETVSKRNSGSFPKTDTTPSRENKTSSTKNRTPLSKSKAKVDNTPKSSEKSKYPKINSHSYNGTPKSKDSKSKGKSKEFISDSDESSEEIDVVSVSTDKKNHPVHSPVIGNRSEVSKKLDFNKCSVNTSKEKPFSSKSPTQVPQSELKTSHGKPKEKKSKEKSHMKNKAPKKESASVNTCPDIRADPVISPARAFITDPLLSPISNFPEEIAIDVPRHLIVPRLNDGRPSIVVHIDLVLLNRVPSIDKSPHQRTTSSPCKNSPPASKLLEQNDFISPEKQETSPTKSKSIEPTQSLLPPSDDIVKINRAQSEPQTVEADVAKTSDVTCMNASKSIVDSKMLEKLVKSAKDDSPSKREHNSLSKHENDKMLTSSSGGCVHNKSASDCDFQKENVKSPVSDVLNLPDKPPPEKFVKRKAESDKITVDVSKRHKTEKCDDTTVDASKIRKSDKISVKPSIADSSSDKVKSSHEEGATKESSKKRHHNSEHRRSSSSSSSSRHSHKTSSKKPKVDEKESDSKPQPSSSKVSEETNGVQQPNGSCTTPVREETNGVQPQNGQNHICNSHPHQANQVAGPLTNGVAESEPEIIYSNHFPLLSSCYRPVKPEKLDYKKLYDKGKEFKHKGQKEKDTFRRNVAFVEAALKFILCGYAQEKDKQNDHSGPFNMYKDSITFVLNSSRLRTHHNSDPETVAKEKKLAVLCMRIHSLLLLKLYRLKKAEAGKLKKILDDHNNKTSSSKPPAHAPSPHQVNWNTRSTGTPSPMSPTPSPSGSVCSVGSAGSCEVPTSKLTNGNICSAMSSPGNVSVPQRIHSVTQQYLIILHYLTQSEDYREQADNLQKEYPDFFYPLDRDHGPITLSCSMPNLVNYVQEGLKRLTNNT